MVPQVVLLLPMLLLAKFIPPSSAVADAVLNLDALALFEAESVRLFEELHASMANYTDGIRQILEAWQEADYESVLPADSPSHFRRLSEKRYLLKYENEAPAFYRARIALSVRLAAKADAGENSACNLTEKMLARKRKLEQYSRDGGGALHPIDAFLFIKRTITDYSSATNSLTAITDVLDDAMHNLKLLQKTIGVSAEGLPSAAEALLDLQEAHHLNTSLLVEDAIPSHVDRTDGPHRDRRMAGRMDLWDRVQVAQMALRTARPRLARSWYESAISLLQEGQTVPHEVMQLQQQLQHVPL